MAGATDVDSAPARGRPASRCARAEVTSFLGRTKEARLSHCSPLGKTWPWNLQMPLQAQQMKRLVNCSFGAQRLRTSNSRVERNWRFQLGSCIAHRSSRQQYGSRLKARAWRLSMRERAQQLHNNRAELSLLNRGRAGLVSAASNKQTSKLNSLETLASQRAHQWSSARPAASQVSLAAARSLTRDDMSSLHFRPAQVSGAGKGAASERQSGAHSSSARRVSCPLVCARVTHRAAVRRPNSCRELQKLMIERCSPRTTVTIAN